MFKKEAEEYTDKYDIMNADLSPKSPRHIVLDVFKAGAAFGYNKANEWHFVKDGDLPKDEEWKWCVSRGGYPYVAKYEELFVSWTNQENKEVMCPYAWKEIVLPTEVKENY